jgi:hypothetical protein
MRDAFQTRILAVALAVATLGVCVLAGFNLSQELNTEFPTDGVTWVEAQGGLRADRVPVDSPAGRAGIRAGDVLEAINGEATPRLASQVRAMYANGIWEHAASYTILRQMAIGGGGAAAATFPVQVYLEPGDRSIAHATRLIALVYLLIGLCAIPAMDCAEVDALLRFLSGVVCVVCIPIDGRAGCVRPGDLLGQPAGECATAGAVSALRGELCG